MTTTGHAQFPTGSETPNPAVAGAQYREQAAAVAQQAQAIADGTVTGPLYAAVRRLQANVETLVAWTGDDRV